MLSAGAVAYNDARIAPGRVMAEEGEKLASKIGPVSLPPSSV